ACVSPRGMGVVLSGPVQAFISQRRRRFPITPPAGTPMFFLQYRIFPTDAHPERDRLGEGLVNCWIDRPTLDEADNVARADVQSRHWQILEREEAAKVSAADYDDNPEWLEHYE